MERNKGLRIALALGGVATASLGAFVTAAPAQAAAAPKLCTTKGKVIDLAARLTTPSKGTYYLRNCTGRSIPNVNVEEISVYPMGPTCPLTIGVPFGSGTAKPHEYDVQVFATDRTRPVMGATPTPSSRLVERRSSTGRRSRSSSSDANRGRLRGGTLPTGGGPLASRSRTSGACGRSW